MGGGSGVAGSPHGGGSPDLDHKILEGKMTMHTKFCFHD